MKSITSLLSLARLGHRLFLTTGMLACVTSFACAATGADTWTTGAGDGTGNLSGTSNWTVGSVNKPPISGDSMTFGATTGTTTLTDNLMTPGTFNLAGITFSAGAASYTINPATPGTNGFTLTGNITNSGTFTETINDNFAMTAARTVTATNSGGNIVLGGNISGTGGQIIIGVGSGNVTLSGTNSFTGISTSVQSLPAQNVSLVVGSTGSGTVTLATSTAAGTGAIELTAGTTTTLLITSGGLSLSNTLVTNNVNFTIGGGNLTETGTLQFGGSNTVFVNNNTTFAGNVDIRDSSASTRTATFAGSGATTITGTVINGFAGATGSVVYAGTGSLTMSGNNSYTGSTTVTQGTLIAGNNVLVSANGAFGNASGAITLGSNSGSGSLTGTAAILTSGTFTVARGITEATTPTTLAFAIGGNQTSGTSTFSGAIGLTATTTLTAAPGGEVDFTGVISNASGNQNVVLGGGGTIKLTGTNTFGSSTAHANSVTIQGGTTLTGTSVGANLGVVGNDLIFNNGVLKFGSVFDPSATRTMTFASGGATFDTAGNTITFANAVGTSGTGGLALNDSVGTGKLILSGTNTYFGGTTVTSGTLQVSGSGNLGSTSGALALGTAGNFDLNNTSQSVGNLSGTGGVITNTGTSTSTLTIGTGNNGGGTYAGAINNGNGTVALTKAGSAQITLTGTNTYTGATTISGGVLSLGTNGSLGGTAINATGGTLQIGTSGSTAAATIGGSGNGSVTIGTGGGLSLANNALNSATINNTVGGSTVLTLTGGGQLTFDVGGSGSDELFLSPGLLASLLGSTTIGINVIGTGLNGTTQQLISWGGYTGAGTLSVSLLSGSTGIYSLSLTQTGTGLFLVESSTSSAYWQGGSNASWATLANFTTDATGTTVRSAALDNQTSVYFTTTSGSVSNFSNTTLDGTYNVSAVNFNRGGVGIANGTGTNTLTIGSGITVLAGAGPTQNTISANVALGATQGWTITDANSTLLVSGNISGSGFGLSKSGLGTLILSGTNSYSGATNVNAGILSIQSNDALDGTSSVSVATGSTLQLQGGITTTNAVGLTLSGTGSGSNSGALENVSGTNTYTGVVALGPAATIASDAGLLILSNTGTITGSGSSLTLTGAGNGLIATSIGTGAGTVTKTGLGTWTFSGANTYSGGTTVSGGILALTGSGTLGNTSATLTTTPGGTVNLGGTNQSVGSLTGSGGSVTNNATGTTSTLTVGTGGTSGSYSGTLASGSGTLALSKTGSGIQTLGGTNSFTGATSIGGGALNVTSNGALGASSGVNVSTGAALQMTGGVSTTNAVGLTLNGNGISGNGALESVSGNNTYSGLLVLGSNATIGSDTANNGLSLTNTGTITGAGFNLILAGAGNGSIASVIGTSTGSLVVNGTGTGAWTISGANTYTGATNINSGTLVYNSVSSLSSSSAVNLGSGTNSANLTYGGSATGTLGTTLNLSGSTGQVTLGNKGTGAITYNAPVFTTAGAKTIVLGNTTDAAGGSISGINDNTLGGAVSLTKAGLSNSTWTLTGTNSHTGSTLITGGVLADASLSDLALSYITLAGSSGSNYAVLQTSGTLTRVLSGTANAANLNWGANSGFAAQGGVLTLNFGGAAASQQWTVGGFMSGSGGTAALVLGSTTANNQVVLMNGFDFGQSAANLGTNFNRAIDVEGSAATIVGGTSNFGVSGNSAQIAGAITANMPIALPNGNGDSGNNGFVKTGQGTLILTGSNTYSGNTVVNGGTLIAGTNALIGVAGAFGDGHTTTYTGTTVTVAGTQAITLGGANYNSGDGNDGTTATGASPTVLIGGAYTVAVPITISNVATTGTYGIGGSTANTSTFSGLITDNLQNFSVTQVAGGTLNITGGITASATGSGTNTITFNNAGAVNVSANPISFVATAYLNIAQSGSGVTTISAPGNYIGTVTVNAGNLVVNGDLNLINVPTNGVTVGTNSAAIATLSGTGSINKALGSNFNLTTSTTGTNVAYIAPGSNVSGTRNNFGSAGTLTIGSGISMVIGDGTNFDYDLASTTTTGSGINDLIALSGGTLTFSGTTTFNFNALTSLSPTGTYTLFSGAGSIVGFNAANFLTTGTGSYTAVFSSTSSTVLLSFITPPSSPTLAYFNGLGSSLNSAANFDTSVSGTTAVSATPSGTTNVYFSANRNATTSVNTTAALAVNSLNFGVGSGTNSGITVSGTSAITITGSNVNGNTGNQGITTTGTGSDTISAPITMAASQTWAVDTGGTLTVSGTVSGSGATLTKAGAGMLVLNGVNTYSGGTTVMTGTLQLAGSSTTNTSTVLSGPVGTGTLTLANGTTLLDSGSLITLSNAVSLGGTINLAGTGGFNFDKGNLTTGNVITLTATTTLNVTDSSTITDNIVGGYSLTKIGNGTLTLTGSNSSSAPVTVSNGTLQYATGASLGSGAISLANATTLQYTGTSSGTLNNSITITGTTGSTGILSNTGGQVLTLSGTLNKNGTTLDFASGKFVVSGTITGTATHSDVVLGTPTGNATVGLSSANTYNGPTTIYNGSTLLTGVAGALPTVTPSDVTLGSGTDGAVTNTLDLLGTSQTVASITSSGTSTTVNQVISSNGSASTPAIGGGASSGTGNLTVNYNGGTTDTYSGSLGGSGGLNNFSLTKSGTGTLALTHASGNTYTGGTTITAGALVVSNSTGSATGSGALTLNSGATLSGTGTINSSGNTINGNVLVGNGATTDVLTMTATGTTTFSGASLTFDLSTTSIGQGSELSMGSPTSILFNGSNTLTLNLIGAGVIPAHSLYVLFTETGGGTGGIGGSAFGGTGISYDSTTHIITGLLVNFDVNGTPSSVYSGSYLQLVNAGGGTFEIVAVVPEPSTWALMIGGLTVLVAFQRIRRNRKV